MNLWARMRAVLREPLVHFLIAGFCLFLFFLVRGTAVDPQSRTISVNEADVTQLVAGWEQTWQRPPTPAELDGLIRDHIKEEVYYREGLRLGLDKDDTVIRRRIRSKMEFLTDARIDAAVPNDATLQAWLAHNPQKYAPEARYSFDQVYLGGSDAAALQARAKSLLAELRRGTDWSRLGDAISLPRSVESLDRERVAATFGADFVAGLEKMAQGDWQGPVQSGFGLHLVRLRKLATGAAPKLADVRQQVENDWRADSREKREAEAYKALLDSYTIRIEKPR
jgi:hypothetical protein